MDAAAAFLLMPFDALLFGAPWRGQELALLGPLPCLVLLRHPLLQATGAMAGYSLAILGHLASDPELGGLRFLLEPDMRGALVAAVGLLLPHGAATLLVSDDIIEREHQHLRALGARLWSWATGKPSPRNTKGKHHVG